MSNLAFGEMLPMVDLKGQYQKIKSEIEEGFQQVLENSQFINGPIVKEFSHKLAAYLHVKHVIPCGNGTDALQIALMAMDLKPGDEVITTPFTFVATAEVIALLGLKPVFIDVDPDTFLMDVRQLEELITDRTKCVIPVHLFGQCVDMESLLRVCQDKGIKILEDNAQAIGAEVQFSDGTTKRAGTIGDIGTTSFFPSKNLGCYGDGGAIFTNDDALADRLRMIVNHGSSKKYFHDVIGVNSRLDSLQAVVLNVKLNHLDTFNESRARVAEYYNERLDKVEAIQTPIYAPWTSHVFHQYTLKLNEGENREDFMNYLKENGISSAVYYPVPLHLQMGYSAYGYAKGDFPVSEALSKRVISLPVHTEMTDEKLDYICEKVIDYFNQ